MLLTLFSGDSGIYTKVSGKVTFMISSEALVSNQTIVYLHYSYVRKRCFRDYKQENPNIIYKAMHSVSGLEIDGVNI